MLILKIYSPIMKRHYLSIMALCDFPANKEFLGRNFNGGERIDLILKSNSGAWLPFKFVQGVLIHELAHCVHMNHSKAFWKVRQEYHDELKELWTRNYTGEGLWGRGVDLDSGEWQGETLANGEDLPEHLCGGTYRSSRKRARKPRLSYKQQKERRIVKKFGVNGVALGADEFEKNVLEKGKSGAKPTVAGSKRGRELRAAAALRRFEIKKEEVPAPESVDLGSETESDYEEAGDEVTDEAKDIDGKRLLDEKGRGVVKVCEDEDFDNEDAQNEMAELQGVAGTKLRASSAKTSPKTAKQAIATTESTPLSISLSASKLSKSRTFNKSGLLVDNEEDGKADGYVYVGNEGQMSMSVKVPDVQNSVQATVTAPVFRCEVCSMDNDPSAPTCMICANVLDVALVSGIWRCTKGVCNDSKYVNCIDVVRCGVCGSRRED